MPGKLPSYLSNNFPRLPSIGILFALYTGSFARSFASSIDITGSLLVISHNRAKTRKPRLSLHVAFFDTAKNVVSWAVPWMAENFPGAGGRDRPPAKARSSGGEAGETAIFRRVEMSAQWRFVGSVGGFWLCCSARLNNKKSPEKKSAVSRLVRVWGIKKKSPKNEPRRPPEGGAAPRSIGALRSFFLV